MLKLATLVVLLCLQLSWAADRVSYDGYKVYHVTPKTLEEAKILHDLEGNVNYDFWLEPRALNATSTLMVTPNEQENFEKLMKEHGIDISVLIQNVETTVPKLRTTELRSGNVTFLDYMTHSEINAYFEHLALSYPNIVQLIDLGDSYEGKELFAIKISSGGEGHPAIFVDAGIHAREWIAPATAVYLAFQLVENADNFKYYENIDWIIFPVVNADGYDYSRSTDSLWRKTRQPTTSANCPGVDGNRNFDYYWMEIGASDQPCAETYAGPQAFSEPETIAVKNYLDTHRQDIKCYLTLHSYGRYLLYPWGYTYDLPSNDEELYNVGFDVGDKIKEYSGTVYQIGSSSNLLYPAAGGSDDYAMGACGIGLSYTIELPEGGTWGFHPPVERILPIVQETFVGFIEFHRYVEEKYVT